MTQPRWAGAWKRAPILPERHPDWTAPRLLRKAEPTGRQTVPPPPHAKPVPPPRRESVRALLGSPTLAAGDPIRGESEQRYAVVPRLTSAAAPHLAARSPARASPPPAATRAGFWRFLSLLIICALGVATGLGAAYLIVRRSPGMAERMTASIDTAVSAFGHIGGPHRAAEAQIHGSAKIVPLPALPATSGDSELETLLQRARGELAERKLEQPPGDNALDSYRQLKAKWPEQKRVAQLGDAIGLAFWSLGRAAQSTGDWNEALHYFKIVNSLPPLPLGSSAPDAADAAAQ
jgi:hypothetical protein